MSQKIKSELAAHKGNVVRSEVNKNADYDLEEWIQERLKIETNQKVLDIGCGNGKQCLALSKIVGDNGHVTGVDIFSKVEGLKSAALKYLGDVKNVTLLDHDANFSIPIKDETFDSIISAYSIYYLDDLSSVMKDFKRLLKSEGKLFIVGPAWDNSKEFYDLHEKISGKKISDNFNKHLFRINDDLIKILFDTFDKVKISPFVNRIYFKGEDGLKNLLDYYGNTMLVAEATSSEEEKLNLVNKLKEEIYEEYKYLNEFIIFKRALGITCSK